MYVPFPALSVEEEATVHTLHTRGPFDEAKGTHFFFTLPSQVRSKSSSRKIWISGGLPPLSQCIKDS